MTFSIIKFRPKTISDANLFISDWCSGCAKANPVIGSLSSTNRVDVNCCEIINRSFLHHKHEEEYPAELIVSNQLPTCTAYIKRVSNDPYYCDKTLDMFGH